MRQKGLKAKNSTIDFLKKVPIYPEKIMPNSLGMKNCNLPTDSLLVEDDDGYIFFLSDEDKNKTIEYYLPDIS